jgi:ribosomal protein S18 acetylase RimI-like enzyme
MNLSFIAFKQPDLQHAFELYKNELRDIVEASFGWDENYQRKRFEEKYALDWFHWIELEGRHVGYVCYTFTLIELHLSLLIIEKQFQRKGLGRVIMKSVTDLARAKDLKITLSSFKNNTKAITFYQNLGFRIMNQDNHFLDFELDMFKKSMT